MEADLRKEGKYKETSPSKIFLDKQARPVIKAVGNTASSFNKAGTNIRKELGYLKRNEPKKVIVKNYYRNEPNNFFAHKSEREVYGDEGITLFDSQKTNRNDRRTGSLFGI